MSAQSVATAFAVMIDALEWVSRGETVAFDAELNDNVVVPASSEEMSSIARQALDRALPYAGAITAVSKLVYVATLVTELADVLGENNAVVQLARAALAHGEQSS